MIKKHCPGIVLAAGLPVLALAQEVSDEELIERPAVDLPPVMEEVDEPVAAASPEVLDFQLFSRNYRQLIGSQPTAPSLGPGFQSVADFPVASTFDMSELNMSLGLWSVLGDNPLSLDLTSNYWKRSLPLTQAGLGWDGETQSGAGMGLGVTLRPLSSLAFEISGHNLMGDLPDTHWSNEVTQEWRWRGSRYWQFSSELRPLNWWSVSLGYRQDTANKENQLLLGTGFELNKRVVLDFSGSMTREQAMEAIFRTSVSF